MEDLDKKEAIREVLKDVRNAHELIVEYQKRILHIMEFIKKEIGSSKYDIFHYPRNKTQIYGDITEFFFGAEKVDEQERNAFCIILATGNSKKEQSELIFILDQNYSTLPRNDVKKRENHLYNVINNDKLDIACNLKIQRENIEVFNNEEALKTEWEQISKAFPPCWINKHNGIKKE